MAFPVRRAWILAVAVAAGPGCRCEERRIDVAWPATVEIASQTPAPVTYTGGVTDSIAGGSYALLRRVVTDSAQASEAHTLLWTMREQDGAPAAFLSFSLRVPIAQGDVATVSLGSSGGGWGVLTGQPQPTPFTARAYYEKAGFVPSLARGTLTVVRSAPLQLAADVTFFAPSGENVRIHGPMSFVSSEFETACFE